jgi:hypothetical protein
MLNFELMLRFWVADRVHRCAEAIGYDLEEVPEGARWIALRDYAGDYLYGLDDPMAAAWRTWRDLDTEAAIECLERNAVLWSL